MTTLTGDIVNRVRRLPKPSSAAEALQPVFEAVSNGMHGIEDQRRPDGETRGIIDVTIENVRNPAELKIIIADDGIGLDDKRFAAFLTTDTDFKSARGGKGIGRLLWLDAFDHVHIVSVFKERDIFIKRSFDFVLSSTDQITNEETEEFDGASGTGTTVTFVGLRGVAYRNHFPAQPAAIVRYFGSHFLAEFILGSSPAVRLTIGERSADFPQDISNMLMEKRGTSTLASADFGNLTIAHFVFRAAASAGFDGNHQLHFIANGRTVTTRKIDGLLGVGRFGPDGNAVYHGCVSGDFLDERVNQERTHFNFDESVTDEITKECAEKISKDALAQELSSYDSDRLHTMTDFVKEYPSFGFASPEDLLRATPKNATKAEQFAQALIPTRIRRDLDRKKRVQEIVSGIGGGHEVSGDFAESVRRATDEVRAEEQRQLTEYVLRRKMVLDVLDVLVKRVRELPSGTEDYHLEETLHQFICPMKIRGDDPTRLESAKHDLWIIDERLTFATYFASDIPVRQIIADSANGERPDVFIWNRLHGLGLEGEDPLRRALLVEFKKPGRRDYEDEYSPQNQIARYLVALSAGRIENYKGERVRIAEDCVFYCYVVADIVGMLDVYTSTWRTTADGRGRWTELSGKYRGSIEIVEWRDLVADARARNAAFIELTGA